MTTPRERFDEEVRDMVATIMETDFDLNKRALRLGEQVRVRLQAKVVEEDGEWYLKPYHAELEEKDND